MSSGAREEQPESGLRLELESASGEVLSAVPVDRDSFTIGRDPTCDLRLDDRKCSREHARIERQGDDWLILDLGGVNGTLIEGKAVTSAPLLDGQLLQVGSSRLRVRRSGAPGAVAASLADSAPAAPAPGRRSGRAVVSMLALACALAAGFLLGRHLERREPPPSRLVDPAGAASRQRPPEIALLADSLLERARELAQDGHLGGAYAALAALEAGLAGATGDAASSARERIATLRATLDTLASERWVELERTAVAARDARDRESARAALLQAERELAGTPLSSRVEGALADLTSLEELTRVPESTTVEDSAAAGAGEGETTPGSGEADPPATAVGEGETPAEETPAQGRTLRSSDLLLASDHLTDLLARMQIDEAVSTAATLEPRLPPRQPAAGDSWQLDPVWIVSSMPEEALLRQALLDAIPARAAAGDPLVLQLPGATASIVAADERGLVLSVEGKGEGRKDWARLDAVTYAALLEQIARELGDDAVLLAGAWARRALPRRGLDLLADLHDRGGRWRDLVAARLAGWQGLPAPPAGGYVIHRGELVTASERDRIVEEERAARAAYEAELARLSATSPQNLPRTLVDYAGALFDRGQFERGHALIEQLVARFPEHPAVQAVAGKAAASAILSSVIAHSVPAVAPGAPPPPNRLVVLIAGDGYVLDDRRQESFSKAADRVIEGFLDHEPFAEYASYLVFQKVHCISKDRTISDEYTQRESLFGGFRPRFGGQVEIDWGRARRVLDAEFGDGWDSCLVMVRQGSLGKGLLRANLCAFQEGAVSIAFHEFGHSFVGLLDEYSTDPYGGRPLTGPIPTGPNLVTSTDLETCPWRHWIEAREPGIGFHEGGAGRAKGVWHPSSRGCVMDAGTDFCVVCREQAVLSIYEHVRPVERTEPDPGAQIELTRPPGDPGEESTGVVLRVVLLKPATHELTVEWSVNDLPPLAGRAFSYRNPSTGEWIAEARLPYSAFAESDHVSPGAANRVTARVADETPWVRSDPGGLLTQTVAWQVRARRPAAVVTPPADEER